MLLSTVYEQRKRKNYSDIEIEPSYIRCMFSLLTFPVVVFSSFRPACMAKFKESTESSGCPQGKIQFTSSDMAMLTARIWSMWLKVNSISGKGAGIPNGTGRTYDEIQTGFCQS
jgi:hypothetical protein